ncbi:MAG: transcription-repair coupling factor [Bacteroidota bacterium]|nr:transcription-repair coupling factor [Bacteroidota bacterium]
MYSNSSKIELIKESLKKKSKINIQGLFGSSISFVIHSLFEKSTSDFLIIFSDKEEAAYYFNDFENFVSADNLFFFPSSHRRAYQIDDIDNANVLLRAEVLNNLNSNNKKIIVTYTEAIFEKVITHKLLESNTLNINVNDVISVDFINETLFEYQFKRVDFVSEPGEFSVRGGIVDVFSFSNEHPYRIEFFGNEVDSIRTFDIETQLSIENKSKIRIIPNIENKFSFENRQSFIEYISENTIVFTDNLSKINTILDDNFQKATAVFEKLNSEIKRQKPQELFVTSDELLKQFENLTLVELSNTPVYKTDSFFRFDILPQPSFNKQFDLLLDDLIENKKNNYTIYLLSSSENQSKRFDDIFESLLQNQVASDLYQSDVLSIYQGFIDREHKLICYTDHQIFERYHKFKIKNGYHKKQTITLKELNSLSVGDYVTHIDHGIGKFGGLQKIQVEGKTQEAIKLVYAENDIVYVSIHSLHKIAKYNGKDGTVPKIYKVGSNAWKLLKQKTKQRVKQVAFDLIQLYAKRRTEKGFAFAPDSYLQYELESSFIYEDTPDQLKATQDVKADMESDRPMDRLVCGDVGFGKTEVAIRAAFKAVDNGKQVAVLVPTTVLAFQHHKTFSQRLKDLPVRIDYLNRFKTTKQKNQTLKDLENGKVDIVIGTHQLVSKNIKFKDLGLLIIDEEQKFGVNVKDKLKTIAQNIDTLTLTATPIPRTLQFSLMSARDLSVITTPPPNRYPIETQLITFSEEIIRDAIIYEIQRGGQLFFIHNRIENIKEVAGMLQRLVPDAKIVVAHGQMDGKQLEGLMLDFMEGAYDILVSTTIIESGLDVPNANTIFINNANNFGLSDLHQMRGRVGRSNKKAFCYFITPSFATLTEEARKRLDALVRYSELGSGFNIAMKDLEIRGAGDLLGAEQSGFINEIGFETYQKIMNEAIEELKENEFKDLYQEEHTDKTYVKDFVLDTDLELLFPDNYINQVTERLNLYNELSDIKNKEELEIFKNKLTDRFGILPKQAHDLINSLNLKWIAIGLGIEKIIIKQDKMICYFIADQQSDFYQSDKFQQLLQYIVRNPKFAKIQEKQTRNGLRLLLSFAEVKNIYKALLLLSELDQL